jgi:hypothetical protein
VNLIATSPRSLFVAQLSNQFHIVLDADSQFKALILLPNNGVFSHGLIARVKSFVCSFSLPRFCASSGLLQWRVQLDQGRPELQISFLHLKGLDFKQST